MAGGLAMLPYPSLGDGGLADLSYLQGQTPLFPCPRPLCPFPRAPNPIPDCCELATISEKAAGVMY